MASKRMFSLSVIDTDAFLEMPCSTQALYFHLCMRADDDGFVGSPKIISRTVGASEDDLKLLIAKRFVMQFEDGVIVIKHWRMHNTLSANRYKETSYLENKAMLKIKPNKAYTLGDGKPLDDTKLVEMSARQTKDEQKTSKRQTKDEQKTSADKISIDKNSIDKDSKEDTATPTRPQKHKYGEYEHVLLTDQERDKLIDRYGAQTTDKAITFLDEYIEMKGYKAKSHFLCIKKWVVDAVKEKEAKKPTGDDVMREWLEEYGGKE